MKYIRFVPPILEKEVDKKHFHFQKIANSLDLPNEYSTLPLRRFLTRKARETSSNNEEVKKAILKAYELVKEANWQKCRSCRKRDDQ